MRLVLKGAVARYRASPSGLAHHANLPFRWCVVVIMAACALWVRYS